MIANETYVCATVSQMIVNNNTIVINGDGKDLKPFADTFSLNRCESFEELPPPVHCSTPKAKGNHKSGGCRPNW